MNDSGYSSAEPDEPDEQIQEQVVWDFESPDVPTFPPEEEEHDGDNGEQTSMENESFCQDGTAGICTLMEMNEKVGDMLAPGKDAKMELMAW